MLFFCLLGSYFCPSFNHSAVAKCISMMLPLPCLAIGSVCLASKVSSLLLQILWPDSWVFVSSDYNSSTWLAHVGSNYLLLKIEGVPFETGASFLISTLSAHYNLKLMFLQRATQFDKFIIGWSLGGVLFNILTNFLLCESNSRKQTKLY